MSADRPSQSDLRKFLRYDRETGHLYWRARSVADFVDGEKSAVHTCNWWNARFAGQRAFTTQHPKGHFQGTFKGRTYKAHRVIWCMETGDWPEGQVDHKDRDNTNNRWDNLREADHGQNCSNRRSAKGSSSPYLGVRFRKSTGRWIAQITAGKAVQHIGVFDCPEEAARAYDAAAIALHGEFANPNFPASAAR